MWLLHWIRTENCVPRMSRSTSISYGKMSTGFLCSISCCRWFSFLSQSNISMTSQHSIKKYSSTMERSTKGLKTHKWMHLKTKTPRNTSYNRWILCTWTSWKDTKAKCFLKTQTKQFHWTDSQLSCQMTSNSSLSGKTWTLLIKLSFLTIGHLSHSWPISS